VREAPLGPLLVVHRGEDVGVGPHRAHLEEHPVGSSQADEEIVDERNAVERVVRRAAIGGHRVDCMYREDVVRQAHYISPA
jgi:hypothetical protein